MNPIIDPQDQIFFVPLIALLVFWAFRMADSIQPKRSGPHVPRPLHPVADPADLALMSDPDGHPWN